MFQSRLGLFDGNSWESLLQRILKHRHGADGYVEMPASPGDWGIEGYVANGIAFQCYCPNKHYNPDMLYIKQRDKITKDIGKLRTNEVELSARLGDTRIKNWCFVTPEISDNKLIKHAKAKETEARAWNLSILSPDFRIDLHTAEHYETDIHAFQALEGKALHIPGITLDLPFFDIESISYEENILRKSVARVAAGFQKVVLDMENGAHKAKVERLYSSTLEGFLKYSRFHDELNKASPLLYQKVKRILSVFHKHVEEWSDTLNATPDVLTEKIRTELTDLLIRELNPSVDYALASQIVANEIAYWLGACQLDYSE